METVEPEKATPSNFIDCYLGEVRLFAGTFAPRGWHFCDGTLLNMNEFMDLYSLIGTKFGGDGRGTFGLPDYRGRIPVGFGLNEQSGTRYALGQQGGADTITLTGQNLPAHSHGSSTPHFSTITLKATSQLAVSDVPLENSSLATVNSDFTQAYAYTEGYSYVGLGGFNVPVQGMGNSSESGTSAPFYTYMPTMAINIIIALAGTYPNRS